MQFDPRDTGLAAAFAVVRQYDPDTYTKMQSASDWRVSTDPFSDLFIPEFTLSLLQMGPTALESEGVTRPRNADGTGNYPMTWINVLIIGLETDQEHISAVFQAAETLVHEFTHIYFKGHNEPEAFRAGRAFAARLPAPDGAIIMRDDDETLAMITAHPEYYPNPVSD